MGNTFQRVLVSGVIAVSIALLSGSAGAVDKKALGRKASTKANYWANHGNCKEALPLFTKAYQLLKDPAILFNRAECYRKTGKNAQAAADYKQFLAEFPAAPNRTQVEGRIAELEGSKPAEASAAATAPAPGAPPPAPIVAAASAAAAPAVPAPAPAPSGAPARPASPPPGSMPVAPAAPQPGAVAEIDDRDLGFKPLPGGPPPAAGIASTSSGAADEGGSVLGSWWFWTLVGVAVAGGAVGGYFAINAGKTQVPASALGNYKF